MKGKETSGKKEMGVEFINPRGLKKNLTKMVSIKECYK